MEEDISFTGIIIKEAGDIYTIENSGNGKSIDLQLGEKPKRFFKKLIVGENYYIKYDSETNEINFVKKSQSELKPVSAKIAPTDLNIIKQQKQDESNNTFFELNKIKCKVDKKGRFNYISWTSAWSEVKKSYPNTTYKVYENNNGFPAFIVSQFGGFVKVGVTINNLEYIEHFPITDNYNKAIIAERIDVFTINTAIKRALVKALAFHGLGLNIYAGEDLPSEDKE